MNVAVLSPLRMEIPVDQTELGGNLFRLTAPLRFRWKGVEYEVPIGYMPDGASVPGFLPNYLGDRATGLVESTIHDWVYEFKIFPKEECDELYDALLQINADIPDWQRIEFITGLDNDIALRAYWKDEFDEHAEPMVGQEGIED